MAREGVQVHWDCHHCKAHGQVDPAKIVAAKGETFSLWDKLRICEKCEGIVTYAAAYRPGNWPFQLLTAEGKQLLQGALDAVWWERNGGR